MLRSRMDFQCQLMASVWLRVNRRLMLFPFDTLPDVKPPVFVGFFFFFEAVEPDSPHWCQNRLNL